MSSICELVREQEKNYTSGASNQSKYVTFDMFETLNIIEAYRFQKHTSGLFDSQGREKPYFDISRASANIWYRATDIDRKNIRVKANKEADTFTAFLATVHLQRWMKKARFGVFLNEWGKTLADYGSAVVKYIEKDGELHCMVMPWSRLIVDPTDFAKAPVIEVLELTPAELRKNKSYDQEMVEKLIEAQEARQTIDGQKIDTRSHYIRLYEIHGELELEYITGKEKDDDTYVQQMHVVSFVEKKDKAGEYDEYTLVKGREKKHPYMITHLLKEDGRTLSIGAYEALFDAQWMANHTAKAIKDQLDLASKLITQTADATFAGQNVLSAIENGDILVHKDGAPLTRIDTRPDITSLQAFGQQWQALAKEINSTPDAISGNTMPSGTAFRQVAILNQESHSLFELMTENKALYLEDMLREYILPFVKKWMDTTDEITATLDSYNLSKIDAAYTKNQAIKFDNEQKKKAVLSGQIAENLNLPELQNGLQETLNATGSQRFFKPSDEPNKTWADLFKDMEWELDIEITDEMQDKNAALTTLSTMFQTVAGNPAILDNPTAKYIFNKILETAGGMSAIELPTSPKPLQSPVQMNPQSPMPVPPMNPQVTNTKGQ